MKRALPLILAAALLAIGFAELDQYGVTWDEALGDLFFGQRYLSFFTTFDARYLDFARDPYPPDHVPNLSMAPRRGVPHEYWPVANTLAAATSVAFSRVLDPFDGFHAVNLLLGAVFLVVFFRFVERAHSTSAAVLATLLLFLMPRVVADLMANIKDFPEMVFFSLTLIAFFTAYEKGSALGIIASGLLWGLALGTKANALFIAPIVILFVVLRGIRRPLLIPMIAAGVVAMIVLFASWPWLWEAPARLLENVRYVAERGRGGTDAAHLAPWLSMVVLTTPPLTLVLFVCGLAASVRRRDPVDLFLLSWIAVVAARLSLPGAINFDGVRHFLELFPPLVALAAIALRRIPRVVLLAVPVIAAAWATWAAHPFETVYWNAFAGGYSGARARGIPQSSDYWMASYRHGLRWINEHAPQGSLLIVPIGGHTVATVAPLRLRPDIALQVPRARRGAEVAPWLASVQRTATTRPVFVMFVPRAEWRTPLDVDAETRLRPVAQWQRDGTPVLLIYRYAGE